MWRLLAGILHVGNITFEDDDDAHHGGTRLSSNGNASKRSLHNAAALWGLSPPALLKLLTMRTIEAGGSRGSRRESALIKPLTTSEASAARDNISRLVYSLLFDFIVAQTNRVLSVEEQSVDGKGPVSIDRKKSEVPIRTLGLLDLFGMFRR
jgi:myosin-1